MTGRFVITGTGHSGTTWLASAFSYLGVATTHEGVFKFSGPLPWPDGLAGDVSLAALPFLNDVGTPDAKLIVIRDPLAVLNSFHRTRQFAMTCPCHSPGAHRESPFTRFVIEHGHLDDTTDEISMAIRHIVDWTANEVPVARIEDIRAGELAYWADLFAAVPAGRSRDLLEGPWLPWNVNSHGPNGDRREWVTWEQIDDHPDGHRLRTYAEQHGYL